MRLLRFATFSLALVFTSLGIAYCQTTSATAGVGDNGSNQNLCLNSVPVKATCTFNVPEADGTATGTSSAAAKSSGVTISGGATVSVGDLSTVTTMGTTSIAIWGDSLTIGNYPAGSSLFVAGSTASTPTGELDLLQIGFTLTLQDFFNGQCSTSGFGQSSCSTTVALQSGPVVNLTVNLGGGASATCDTVGCASNSGFNGSAKVLALAVVDSNGDPIAGTTITSASGHKYPSHFASTTGLTTSQNPSTQGSPVTFTATVASFGRSGTPTGKVTFKNSTTGTTLGHATLNASGVASLTTSSLPIGTDTIKATYGGDDWSAASHATVSQVVD